MNPPENKPLIQGSDVIAVGEIWAKGSRPRIRMGVVEVRADSVVCQRVDLPFEEGQCAPYPLRDFLRRYFAEKPRRRSA